MVKGMTTHQRNALFRLLFDSCFDIARSLERNALFRLLFVSCLDIARSSERDASVDNFLLA